jgi:enamine deaminase RidA (YjgF/YER057c/UK114 family)
MREKASGGAARMAGMSDAARLICSPELTDVAEYAYAALVTGGSSLVYAAGACPLNKDGATVGVGDVPAQAAQAMRNLRVSLHDAGASFDDIVRTTVYVASSDQRHLVAAWQVVRDTLALHNPPSTLLGVAVLGYPHQLVEVDAIAALPG